MGTESTTDLSQDTGEAGPGWGRIGGGARRRRGGAGPGSCLPPSRYLLSSSSPRQGPLSPWAFGHPSLYSARLREQVSSRPPPLPPLTRKACARAIWDLEWPRSTSGWGGGEAEPEAPECPGGRGVGPGAQGTAGGQRGRVLEEHCTSSLAGWEGAGRALPGSEDTGTPGHPGAVPRGPCVLGRWGGASSHSRHLVDPCEPHTSVLRAAVPMRAPTAALGPHACWCGAAGSDPTPCPGTALCEPRFPGPLLQR